MWRNLRLTTLAATFLAGTAINGLAAGADVGVGTGNEPYSGTFGSGGPGSQGNPDSPQGAGDPGSPPILGNRTPLPGGIPLPGTVSPILGSPGPSRESR